MTLQCTIDQLRRLKLTGMLSGLEHQLSQTADLELACEQRLGHLLDAETDAPPQVKQESRLPVGGVK